MADEGGGREAETVLVAERPPFLVSGSSAFGREVSFMGIALCRSHVRCVQDEVYGLDYMLRSSTLLIDDCQF